jgi:hypothetical protein
MTLTDSGKKFTWIYPLLVGIFLGCIQTGLFFQLSFTLSSSFGTYLMVTLSWLVGSASGVYCLARLPLSLRGFLLLALLAYAACAGLLAALPFQSQWWWLYAVLVLLAGVYPGVFFARMAAHYPARTLFFWENNGFIMGLMAGTLLFMLFGRPVLWLMPVLLAAAMSLFPEK